MSLQTAKISLAQKILSLEQESLIKKIDAIWENEMIVGYTAEGKPLTKKDYIERIKLAEEQLKSGLIISQEDLENETDTW